jgi:hypothetical protein
VLSTYVITSGEGSIWPYSLQCTGNETSVEDCRYLTRPSYYTSCDHSDDVGVRCGK